MVAVFVRVKVVKVAGDKGKVSEKNERFFDFLGLEGSTIEEKSKVFMDLKEKEGSQMMKKQFCYYAFVMKKTNITVGLKCAMDILPNRFIDMPPFCVRDIFLTYV